MSLLRLRRTTSLIAILFSIPSTGRDGKSARASRIGAARRAAVGRRDRRSRSADDGCANAHQIEQFEHVVRMHPDAPVCRETITARRLIGPVNTHTGRAETEPPVPKRVGRAGKNLCQDGLPAPGHFRLNRHRNVPYRVDFFQHDLERAERRPPVRPADGHRHRAHDRPVAKDEQHALRDVHGDPFAICRRSDVPVVNREAMAGSEDCSVTQAVIARERARLHAKPCCERGQAVAAFNLMDVHAAGDTAVRLKRRRRARAATP